VLRNMSEHGATPDSIPVDSTFQFVLSGCLQRLNSYSTGTAIYILSCLCPEDFDVILNLVRLDLNGPHDHKHLLEQDVHIAPRSYENLLSNLRAQTSIVPPKEYSRFWLELTRHWLLTCPVDPVYDQYDESGKDIFCQRLRNELIDRILNIS